LFNFKQISKTQLGSLYSVKCKLQSKVAINTCIKIEQKQCIYDPIEVTNGFIRYLQNISITLTV